MKMLIIILFSIVSVFADEITIKEIDCLASNNGNIALSNISIRHIDYKNPMQGNWIVFDNDNCISYLPLNTEVGDSLKIFLDKFIDWTVKAKEKGIEIEKEIGSINALGIFRSYDGIFHTMIDIKFIFMSDDENIMLVVKFDTFVALDDNATAEPLGNVLYYNEVKDLNYTIKNIDSIVKEKVEDYYAFQ